MVLIPKEPNASGEMINSFYASSQCGECYGLCVKLLTNLREVSQISEKAFSRAFSLLKVRNSAFTNKTLCYRICGLVRKDS